MDICFLVRLFAVVDSVELARDTFARIEAVSPGVFRYGESCHIGKPVSAELYVGDLCFPLADCVFS